MESIHASRVRCAMHVAGGGARALGWLASVPNCSRTLVEASVPYARESTVAIVGEARARAIERYASLEMAEALAEVQSLLNIFELIAVMVLFVDLVLRFDHIASRWQVPRVAAVGLCLTGMLFKWFILYLHLSYLVD